MATKWLALVALLIGCGGVFAQDSTTSLSDTGASALKLEDVNDSQKNKVSGDVDDLITNNLLRASSGSKSKYSISTVFTYSGSTIEEPLAEHRPNITQGSNNTDAALLAGDINGKYSIDQTHAILAGFGLRWITPLYGSSTPTGFTQKFDADNPNFSYEYIYKWLGVQSVLTVGPTFYTAQDQRALGYVSDWDIAQNNVYEIGHTGLSLGLMMALDYETFDKNGGLDAGGSPILSDQTDYKYGLYPFLEYQLTSKINFRALTGAIFEHHRDYANGLTFVKDKVYESMGVGISVTRDIFLYPNVQFIPDQMRPNQTNVAIASYINIF